MTLKADASSPEAAKQKALSLLEKRDYSRCELLQKLREKGFSDAHAEAALDRLCALGFVDDARYAPLLVRRCAAKGYGPRRVRQELQRRGIPKELWDMAMEQLPEQDDTIDRLLRSRLLGADPEDRAALKKASDALLRRGFSWEEIKEAIERYRVEDDD